MNDILCHNVYICSVDMNVVLSNSRSPISGNKRVSELGGSITYSIVCLCVCVCVHVFAYSCLNFSVGWHERMSLLHYAAGKVTNTSFLLSIIGILYLQKDYMTINIPHIIHTFL